MNYLKLTEDNLNGAAELAIETLSEGGIVLLPFDTVYGLIADPCNEQAVEKIFDIKGRAKTKTLGLAVSNLDQMSEIAQIKDKDFIQKKVPGKFTFILKAKDKKFQPCCFQKDTIGLRVPDCELISLITKNFGPVAQTSANKSGEASCNSIDQIKKQLKKSLDLIDLIIDGGKITNSKSSEIWDLTGDEPKRIER